jgi:acylphosphatase
MTETGAIVRGVFVGGVVQGVGYREFTRRAALRLSVAGWVRNRSDGTVEALICGPSTAVEALIAEMRKGPRSAVVNNLTVTQRQEADRDDYQATFIIRTTP